VFLRRASLIAILGVVWGCGTHSHFQSAKTLDQGQWETAWGVGWNSIGTATIFSKFGLGLTNRFELGLHFELLQILLRPRVSLLKQNEGKALSWTLGAEFGKFFPLSNYWSKYPASQQPSPDQLVLLSQSQGLSIGVDTQFGYLVEKFEMGGLIKFGRLLGLPGSHSLFGGTLRYYSVHDWFIGFEICYLTHNWTLAPLAHEGFQSAFGVGQVF
jgi:hypothetical protein